MRTDGARGVTIVGMTTQSSWASRAGATMEQTRTEPEGTGWVLFAAIMVFLTGILNIIYGIAAVGRSHFFAGDAHYIISDLRTWGWVAIGLGVLEFPVAYSILRGGAFGRWFGIGMASLGLVAALMSLPGAPFWSLTVVVLDLLVIYALANYGGRPDLNAARP